VKKPTLRIEEKQPRNIQRTDIAPANGSTLDDGDGVVHYHNPAFCTALGFRSRVGGLLERSCRRSGTRKLGMGPRCGSDWNRPCTACVGDRNVRLATPDNLVQVPEVGSVNHDMVDSPADPEVLLALTPRSGPIVIEIEYRVDPGRARTFYGLMQQVQRESANR